jgi:hypothetical protein
MDLPNFDLRLRFARDPAGSNRQGGAMPQILVVADVADETANTLVYRERIATTDLESAHFSGPLREYAAACSVAAVGLEQACHEGLRLLPPGEPEWTEVEQVLAGAQQRIRVVVGRVGAAGSDERRDEKGAGA